MATQLETQRSINRALSQRTKLLKQQNELLTYQLNLAAGIQKIEFAKGPKEVNEIVQETNELLKKLTEEFHEASDAGTTMANDVAKAMLKVKTPTQAIAAGLDLLGKKYPIATAAALGFVDGVVSGSKFIGNMLKSTLGLVTSIGKAFIDVGLSIIALPFRALDGLVAVANKLSGFMESVARATEEVRKQFGDISKGPAKDVLDVAKSVGTGFENIGLSGFRVFGSLDERIQAVNRVATAMGAAFEGVSAEFKEAGGGILLLQKGLGLTDENMKDIALRAKALGTSMQTQMQRMTKFSVDFSKKFNVSQKLISRDMGIMTDDVEHFGVMSQREMAKTSVYARKLNIDVKDLLGVVDKFDTFESAAESAAMLSQAFGTNIDVIKIMKAENPADRVDQLRQAFLATGRSAEQLTRQERKLLAQQTGLSEKNLSVAFSQKSIGVSMQELEKQGKITEERQLSTAEAVIEVKKAIEKTIKPMGQFESFLKAFADGFARGIFVQDDFRSMLTKINRALAAVKMTGIEVGKAFASMPFIKDITQSLGAFFDLGTEEKPGKFRKFLNDITKDFKRFFNDLGKGKTSLPELMKILQKRFMNYFSPDKPEGQKFLRGLEGFGGMVSNIFASMIDVVSEGAIKLMDAISNLLDGKGVPNINGGGLVSKLLKPIISALERNGPKLWDSFLNLLDKLWIKLQPKLEELGKKVLPWFVAFIVGEGVLKMASAVLTTVISQLFVEAIKGAFEVGLKETFTSIVATIQESIVAPIANAVTAMIGSTVAAIASVVAGVLFAPWIASTISKAISWVAGLIADGLDWLADATKDTFFGSFFRGAADFVRDISGFFADVAKRFDSLKEHWFGTLALAGRLFIDMIAEWFGGLKDLGKRAYNIAGDIVMGFLNGLKPVKTIISDTFQGALDKIHDVFKIHSPSKETEGVGKNITEGLRKGIEKIPEILGNVSIEGLNAISDKFKSFDAKGFVGVKGALDALIGVLDQVQHIANTIGEIGNVIRSLTGFVKTRIPKNLGDMVAHQVESIASSLSPSNISQINALLVKVNDNKIDAARLKSTIESFEMLNALGEQARDVMKSPLLSTQNIRVPKASESPVVKAIKAMVDEAQAIENSLGELSKPIDIDARLESLGRELGLKDKEFKIERKNVQVNLNVTVTIEADKLAKVLVDQGKLVSTEGR